MMLAGDGGIKLKKMYTPSYSFEKNEVLIELILEDIGYRAQTA
jgi:hypothetical protein